MRLAERVSGDSTVGHALAFCQAVESAAGVTIPRRAAYIRAILLEMERLYNHVADFGMIVSDTGFAVAHAQCYRIRERLLRLNHAVTGNRLLRGGRDARRRGLPACRARRGATATARRPA